LKLKLKSALAGMVSLAFAGAGLIAIAGSASATPSSPAWEPDPQSPAPYANLTFYNSLGQQVTSGNNLAHLFDYAVGDSADPNSANNAQLYFAAPNHSLPTSGWFVQQTSSSAFPLTSGPADLRADTTEPIDALSATDGNLTSFLGAATLDSTAGYANVIQVRMKDTGFSGGSDPDYWDADVAYCAAGGAACAVLGNTIQPGTWQEIFPFITGTATTVTTTPSTSPQNSGTDIKVNATVSPAENGSVQFFDGTTAIGSPVAVTTTTTFPVTFDDGTPANGTHNFSAVFTPTVGQETGKNTGTPANGSTPASGQTENIIGGSTSNTVAMTLQAPAINTTTTLGVTNGSITQGQSDTFNAAVTEADSGTAGEVGKVQFQVNGSNFGAAVTTGTLSGTTTTYSLTTTTLPPGTDNITAVYTPNSTSYNGSTSNMVPVTVASSQAHCATTGTGNTCSDAQNLQVTVSAGSITIATPYNANNPFILPAMTLSPDGTFLESTSPFSTPQSPSTGSSGPIVVTSTLAGNPGWTLTVSATNLSDGSGGVINDSGIGFTGGQLNGGACSAGPAPYFQTCSASSTFPGSVSFTDNPAHNPSSVDHDTNSGLSSLGGSGGLYQFATTNAGDGTAIMNGSLTVLAPTATPPGTYTGTLTFTIS
jgi:Bacterial Ig-like domain (group 3)